MFNLAKNRKRFRVDATPEADCYLKLYPLEAGVYLVAFRTLLPANYVLTPVWEEGFTLYKVHHPKDENGVDAYLIDFGSRMVPLRLDSNAACYSLPGKDKTALNGVDVVFESGKPLKHASFPLVNGVSLIALESKPLYATLLRFR